MATFYYSCYDSHLLNCMAQFIPIIFVNFCAIIISPSYTDLRSFALSLSSYLYRKTYKAFWKHRLKKYPLKYFILAIVREIFVTSFPFFALLTKNKMYTVSHFYRVQSFLLIPEKSNARSEFETRQRGKL